MANVRVPMAPAYIVRTHKRMFGAVQRVTIHPMIGVTMASSVVKDRRKEWEGKGDKVAVATNKPRNKWNQTINVERI